MKIVYLYPSRPVKDEESYRGVKDNVPGSSRAIKEGVRVYDRSLELNQ